MSASCNPPFGFTLHEFLKILEDAGYEEQREGKAKQKDANFVLSGKEEDQAD